MGTCSPTSPAWSGFQISYLEPSVQRWTTGSESEAPQSLPKKAHQALWWVCLIVSCFRISKVPFKIPLLGGFSPWLLLCCLFPFSFCRNICSNTENNSVSKSFPSAQRWSYHPALVWPRSPITNEALLQRQQSRGTESLWIAWRQAALPLASINIHH